MSLGDYKSVHHTAAPPAAATVYVYRYGQFNAKGIRPSVFCDELELGRIQSGREFAVTLEPGRHVFRSNDAQSVVSIDLKAGETYFVRVEMATGFLKGHGRVVLVAPEQGREEVLRLEPSDRDMIRDFNRRVSLHPFAPPPPSAAVARDATPTLPPSNPSSDRAITNEDIVSLVRAGLSDAAVIAKIRTSRTAFRLDPDDLVALKTAGVSSEIIQAMLTSH